MSAIRRVDHGPVAALGVHRPAARNALDPAAMSALCDAVRELERALAEGGGPRALVIHGGGGRFISGGDLKALAALRTPGAAAEMAETMQGILARLEALPIPVLAAVDQYAIGGGAEVMLAAHLAVIAADAWVAFRQVKLAVTTAWGGTRRLVQRVGPARARRLLWTGAPVAAAESLAMGLVDVVAPEGQTAEAAALALAASIAAEDPASVQGLHRLVAEAGRPANAHAALEAEIFGQTWAAPAHWAAVDAHWRHRARHKETP